jgi:cyclophilin family peptidyl-prolyl cis-trans isomerase
MKDKNNMRHSILYIMIFALILALFGCTPPPDRVGGGDDKSDTEAVTEDTTTGGDESTGGAMDQTGETTETGDTTQDENGDASSTTIINGEDGSSTITDMTGDGTESPAEDSGEADSTTSSLNTDDVFGYYSMWPASSITDEEVEWLRNITCVLETTKGIIKIRLFPDQAPIHSANFAKLIQEGFYDGSPFHRVIAGFMTQGGGRPDGSDSGYVIPAEIGLPHKDGSLAAARTDNPQRNSSGSQFYLCHSQEGSAHLDGAYTVYGEIIEGQDVNLSINVTNPGVEPDRIIRAYIE